MPYTQAKRQPSTDRQGRNFSELTIWAVWQKARAVAGYDSRTYRQDACGAMIKFGEYGNTGSIYGWEVDHIVPVSAGGSDDLSNLQPLQWENNRAKSDSPTLQCARRLAYTG